MATNFSLTTPVYLDSKMLHSLTGKAADAQSEGELLNDFIAQGQESGALLKLNELSEGVEVKAGSWVQLEGRIYPNPLVNLLDAFLQLMTISGIDVNSKPQNPAARLYPVPATAGNAPQGEAAILEIFQQLRHQLTDSAVLDCLMIPVNELLAVTSFQVQNLPNARPDVLYIGEYSVIGKVTRVAPQGDALSLYDRTPFRHIERDFFASSFESLGEIPWMKLPTLSTHAPGPAIQVLPLAVII